MAATPRPPQPQILTRETISERVSNWKRWLATQHRIQWQGGFFEHRLRSFESREEKAHYILQNPVRAGLAQKAEDWPFVWISAR